MVSLLLTINAVLVSLCFLGHTFLGTKETLRTEIKTSEIRKEWLQSFCAWNLLSVDLLALCLVAWWLALNASFNIASGKWDTSAGVFMLAVLFLVWSAVWTLTLIAKGEGKRSIRDLPHALVFFVIGIVYGVVAIIA